MSSGPTFWVLDGHEVISTSDVHEWTQMWETDSRYVGNTEVGDARVSTVFLGIDHRFSGDGPPLVFETMVFGLDDYDEQYTERYATWDEAERGHARIVEMVREWGKTGLG